MEFRPAATLKSRTFVGLLIAQFLAAFNDQAIHASAMFFAFHMKLLNEKQAISLMPILFYAPWAIFCTLAGYFADRFSKRHSLVFWKFAEIVICAVALFGFYLGDVQDSKYGPAIVLGCVFLMGTHSAFFVPAKYGTMPEILEPQILSRGNGLLESLSFLAVILGTVSGGVMSFWFYDRETWIGVVLLVLAIVGARASLMIQVMPAANPTRRFPSWIYGPLVSSLNKLLGVRPLALAGVGIAFFTFMVAFMRQTVYMLGESQTPRWPEWKTSLIVGSTAFGIGLGSPLAGWLSGKKIELGLVPLGALGMTIAAALCTFSLHWEWGPWMGIVAIGFFTGFYLVPLYTLLQHRAPKQSKGDLVATSNFINVVGAMLASVIFFVLVSMFQSLGYAKQIEFTQPKEGILREIKYVDGRLVGYFVEGVPPLPDDRSKFVLLSGLGLPPAIDPNEPPVKVIERRSKEEYKGRIRIHLQGADDEPETIYDNSNLPGFLFFGAAVMAALSLLGLIAIMPDLPARAAFAVRHLFGPRVSEVGTHHLPPSGPLVLVTNITTREDYRYLRSANDRRIVPVGLVGRPETWMRRVEKGLEQGRVVVLAEPALGLAGDLPSSVPIMPAFVGPVFKYVRVSFGTPLASRDPVGVTEAIRAASTAEEDYHGH